MTKWPVPDQLGLAIDVALGSHGCGCHQQRQHDQQRRTGRGLGHSDGTSW
ncbi:MAG: hypothetical protein V9H69_11190 [Anaerolineae bacterium]